MADDRPLRADLILVFRKRQEHIRTHALVSCRAGPAGVPDWQERMRGRTVPGDMGSTQQPGGKCTVCENESVCFLVKSSLCVCAVFPTRIVYLGGPPRYIDNIW